MHEASVVATELVRSFIRAAKNPRVRLIAAMMIIVLLVLLVVYRYSPKAAYASCPFRISDSGMLPMTQGDAFRVNTCVTLEVASTNSERTLGLSGRQEMARDRGMLFDFARADEYCMWMKDMHFSLDILWLNDNKEIVHMIENITPDTYPKSFCGPGTARYVVEVNDGIIKAADLRVGQRLKF